MAKNNLPDIKPYTPIASLDRSEATAIKGTYDLSRVARLVGMNEIFVRKVTGKRGVLDAKDVLLLLDQDAFSETFVPRSKIIHFLSHEKPRTSPRHELVDIAKSKLEKGNALDLINKLPLGSIGCVVTSSPYWALRIYKDSLEVDWSDGEKSAYGHEQTPEGFVRHTTEILDALYPVLDEGGSVWWNIMDSYNTRTQIRGNAAEALRAMQGKESKSWGDHDCRRYSAGHSFLKDGEQCLIPARIAERASRLGYYVKSIVTWSKPSTLPEPQESRVSRSLEYVLHLTKVRTPKFDKDVYRQLPATLGGRNNGWETDKLSDVWTLQTSAGRDGHGAQFPISLPARCIALTTKEDDLVLDPFAGTANSGVAAISLGRRFLGFDVSGEYLAIAEDRLRNANAMEPATKQNVPQGCQENLL